MVLGWGPLPPNPSPSGLFTGRSEYNKPPPGRLPFLPFPPREAPRGHPGSEVGNGPNPGRKGPRRRPNGRNACSEWWQGARAGSPSTCGKGASRLGGNRSGSARNPGRDSYFAKVPLVPPHIKRRWVDVPEALAEAGNDVGPWAPPIPAPASHSSLVRGEGRGDRSVRPQLSSLRPLNRFSSQVIHQVQ